MKNKRGLWLGEETGKIVLGVIGIVLMIFLLIKLIGIFIQRTEYEQAKTAMKEIEDTINSLKEGEVGYAFIESPKDWYILAYSTGQRNQEIPKTCGEKNCLCLCKEDNERNCETGGVCKSFENRKLDMNEYYIKEPNLLESIASISTIKYSLFKIEEVPLRLTFMKYKDSILIVPSYSDKKTILTPKDNPKKTSYFYVYINNKFEPLEIPYISGYSQTIGILNTFRIDGVASLIKISKEKQLMMLKDRKKSNIVMPSDISKKAGNIKIYLVLNGENKRKIYLSDGFVLMNCIGEVSPEGYVWLSKEVVEDLFDKDQKLIFYEQEKKNIYTSFDFLLYKKRRFEIYRTNLWTGIKFEE